MAQQVVGLGRAEVSAMPDPEAQPEALAGESAMPSTAQSGATAQPSSDWAVQAMDRAAMEMQNEAAAAESNAAEKAAREAAAISDAAAAAGAAALPPVPSFT